MLHLHRAERADGLVAALGGLLAVPPDDPLAPEVVSVPSKGVERWLAQTLADRLGVCANVLFPPPGQVVRDAVAAACGVEPETDPWRAERSAWALQAEDASRTSELPAKYLNRLSDLLFILARTANPNGDVKWVPGGAA